MTDRTVILQWLRAVTKQTTRSVTLSRDMALRLIQLLEGDGA